MYFLFFDIFFVCQNGNSPSMKYVGFRRKRDRVIDKCQIMLINHDSGNIIKKKHTEDVYGWKKREHVRGMRLLKIYIRK